MNTKIAIVLALIVLLKAHPIHGDTIWNSGHHEVIDGDIYGEIWMYNDATVDILGGEIYRLAAYDVTATDWFAGQMFELWVRDNSIVNIHGGTLNYYLWAAENSVINLYAYDVTYHPTGGDYDPQWEWIEGRYLDDDSYFSFDLGQDTFSHITVVPEPTTLLLLALGALFLRKPSG